MRRRRVRHDGLVLVAAGLFAAAALVLLRTASATWSFATTGQTRLVAATLAGLAAFIVLGLVRRRRVEQAR